ncbi:MAG: hypothetical protein ACLVJ6_07245 [Merdibacter sp.]
MIVGLIFWRFDDQEVFVDVQDEVPKDISSSEIGYIMNRLPATAICFRLHRLGQSRFPADPRSWGEL